MSTHTDLPAASEPRLDVALVDAINARLEVCEVVEVDRIADDGPTTVTWPAAEWTVLRMQLRPEFSDLDSRNGSFEQESAVMRTLEQDTNPESIISDHYFTYGALYWDEADLDSHLSGGGLSHFMVRVAAQEQITAALKQLPVITDQQRADIREQIDLGI